MDENTKMIMCYICFGLSLAAIVLSIIALNKSNKSTFADRNSASQGSVAGTVGKGNSCFAMRPGSWGCDDKTFRCKDGLTCNETTEGHGGNCVKGNQKTFC